ncbi:17210_t:CDS:2 [Acaulospora morrowiae]|uniref:17210_t:CDS:1 n=1 Tax=Acaulospora morrowiae TaxID=94023 RepID=A0A9N9B558_9GLOM|nr:17210_t:CDS:2 [Acaulospora morrowiae]
MRNVKKAMNGRLRQEISLRELGVQDVVHQAENMLYQTKKLSQYKDTLHQNKNVLQSKDVIHSIENVVNDDSILI